MNTKTRTKIVLMSGTSLMALLTGCTQEAQHQQQPQVVCVQKTQQPASLNQQVEDERKRLEIDRLELERKKIQIQKDSLDKNSSQATRVYN